MCERPDVGAGADLGLDADGVLDVQSVGHDAVDEAGVGADLAAVADDRAALEDRARVQRDVTAELDGDVEEGLARVEHRDAVQQPVAVGAVAQLALGERRAASGR